MSIGIHETDKLFLDIMVTQIVDKLTKSKNFLNLALISNVLTVIDVNVKHPFASSDHKIVHLTINCPVHKINKEQLKVYLYIKGDCESFNQELATMLWDEMETNLDRFKRKNALLDKYTLDKYIKLNQTESSFDQTPINTDS